MEPSVRVNCPPHLVKKLQITFYKEKYENPANIDLSDLSWFPILEKPKMDDILAPYKPKDIKKTH